MNYLQSNPEQEETGLEVEAVLVDKSSVVCSVISGPCFSFTFLELLQCLSGWAHSISALCFTSSGSMGRKPSCKQCWHKVRSVLQQHRAQLCASRAEHKHC